MADRRLVALIGRGSGPRIALRARNVVVRIRGLIEGGEVQVTIDEESHMFDSEGDYRLLGGEFAQVNNTGDKPIICEFIT